ncbi:hypothetical protein [Methylobacterium sp. NFXW15]|uniref:hypothetical protein n=1 Tax=Methylobacterium sp. NFXW15 TaxID=2819512 RepID=UPI003CEBC757
MTPQTMESILEFCMGKIPDEDLMTLEEMMAKQVPAKEIAADAAIKRRAKLAMDCALRGYKVERKRAAQTIVADRDAILALHPNMFRIGDGSNVGFVKPMTAKQAKPMTEAERTESAAAFPHMFKKH